MPLDVQCVLGAKAPADPLPPIQHPIRLIEKSSRLIRQWTSEPGQELVEQGVAYKYVRDHCFTSDCQLMNR